MHPVQHLDARMITNTRQRLPPSLMHHDGAYRAIETAALGAFRTVVPGRVDGADEIDTGIGFCGKRDHDLARSRIVIGVQVCHGAAVPPDVATSPVATTRFRWVQSHDNP